MVKKYNIVVECQQKNVPLPSIDNDFINLFNKKLKKFMKNSKVIALGMSSLILLSGCNMSNMAKGGLIGGGAGTALGAGVGYLIGKNAKGTAIGAAVGAAVGTGAGLLIGKKMDKVKAAAQAAAANAQINTVKDANGLDMLQVVFDNGILFQTGKYNLQAAAQNELRNFANNVLKANNDLDVAIHGYASSDGDDQKNLTLSQNRANAVKSYLTGTCGVNASQIKNSQGFGETNLVLNANGTENREASRRVEVYLYASEAMIKAANAGTLQ